jgi:hypothetical protein
MATLTQGKSKPMFFCTSDEQKQTVAKAVNYFGEPRDLCNMGLGMHMEGGKPRNYVNHILKGLGIETDVWEKIQKYAELYDNGQRGPGIIR